MVSYYMISRFFCLIFDVYVLLMILLMIVFTVMIFIEGSDLLVSHRSFYRKKLLKKFPTKPVVYEIFFG